MGIFDKLFGGGKKEKGRATNASKGIQTLMELFTTRGILYPSEYVKRAIKELKKEGTSGSKALADLINELLACRSEDIKSALIVAQEVPSVPKLVEAVRSVASAPETAIAPVDCPFTPEIIGEGKVGWTTGTHKEIRKLSRTTLDVLSGKNEGGAKKKEQPNTKEKKVKCVRCGKLVPKAETTRLAQGLICKKCDQELTCEIMKDMRGF